MEQEMELLAEAAAEQLEKLFIMYETNEYHVKDITDALVTASAETK